MTRVAASVDVGAAGAGGGGVRLGSGALQSDAANISTKTSVTTRASEMTCMMPSLLVRYASNEKPRQGRMARADVVHIPAVSAHRVIYGNTSKCDSGLRVKRLAE